MFLSINDLKKVYNTGEVPYTALKDISAKISEGKITVIIGPSGSGKSTLLNILGGIDRADDGQVCIDDDDITKFNDSQLTEYRQNKIGFVFQFYNLIPNLNVYENVELAANLIKLPGLSKHEQYQRKKEDICNILKAVGLFDKKDSFPNELSGGQQQRVSIARALVKKPRLLLCDEPTGALDSEMSKEILKLIANINKENKTNIIIITHNLAITEMAHRIITIKNGKVVNDKENTTVKDVDEIEW